ncbi:metallophosphoesterase family protein, partial [Roseiarcus sp.]|uniref:metallophosphoesterase family protein n=1 Tax=Roseiarcus sp. TaxID=1969460 RepID=UPI003F9B46D8
MTADTRGPAPASSGPAPLIDPRLGDFESDHAAPKQRALLAIAGSLLSEISLTKLAAAWAIQILAPAVLLGLAPLILTASIGEASNRFAEATEIGAIIVVVVAAAVAVLGWRPLFRLAESNFWSLNALAVQPGYAFWREAIRHVAERSFGGRTGPDLGRMRATSCAAAGVVLFVVAALVASVAWPMTQWIGTTSDLMAPQRLIVPTIANTIVVMSAYLAVAALVWGIADATTDQPLDLPAPGAPPPGARVFRVAHLSDVHVVGERYGMRIESGRAGARSNARLRRALARLSEIHAERPLDLVLVTGDMTDAGTSAEWAEFLDILGTFPELAARALITPGNHDVNIVDRANPARLDLPFSPMKALRRMRVLSAVAAIHGDRVETMREGKPQPLADALETWRPDIAAFADRSGFRLSTRLQGLWNDTFPLILPPEGEDGLAVAILDSNADTHFSFTNALGLISTEQAGRLTAALEAHPRAGWIVALHHHVTEYPRPVA